MNIELNKCYRTRDGRKARVICVDRKDLDGWCVLYLVKNASGIEFTETSGYDGLRPDKLIRDCDLISEWVDKPEMDRSVLPPWIKAVAMDENGSWFGYMYRPFRVSSVWITNSEVNNDHCYIPPSHAPKWSGDWRESLLVFED